LIFDISSTSTAILALRFPHTQRVCGIPHTHEFFFVWHSWIFENRALKWVWDNAGCGCNVAVPNLPQYLLSPYRRLAELARPRPVCKNIWGEIGDCQVTATSRRWRRVVPHTHFWVCGTVQLGKFLFVAETLQWCNAQAGTVSGVTHMYACGRCIRAGRSCHSSCYWTRWQLHLISCPAGLWTASEWYFVRNDCCTRCCLTLTQYARSHSDHTRSLSVTRCDVLPDHDSST